MRASINSATMVRQEVTELVEVLTNHASTRSATILCQDGVRSTLARIEYIQKIKAFFFGTFFCCRLDKRKCKGKAGSLLGSAVDGIFEWIDAGINTAVDVVAQTGERVVNRIRAKGFRTEAFCVV